MGEKLVQEFEDCKLRVCVRKREEWKVSLRVSLIGIVSGGTGTGGFVGD